jgi:precorrin-8X/cobalt-precorrin-8 methylmutase
LTIITTTNTRIIMANHLRHPQAITGDSFRQIRRELAAAGHQFEPPFAHIIERIIHSTADFDFANITRFSPGAVEAGVGALRQGCNLVCDVNMVRVGISRTRVTGLGGALYCFVGDGETRQRAERENTTRSAMGFRRAAEQGLLPNAMAVIGNAPTALYEVIDLANEGIHPALIIGVPVGFVGAAESKDALTQMTIVPWITTLGRKGGSPVAVAIVNALLRLAADAPATEID